MRGRREAVSRHVAELAGVKASRLLHGALAEPPQRVDEFGRDLARVEPVLRVEPADVEDALPDAVSAIAVGREIVKVHRSSGYQAERALQINRTLAETPRANHAGLAIDHGAQLRVRHRADVVHANAGEPAPAGLIVL